MSRAAGVISRMAVSAALLAGAVVVVSAPASPVGAAPVDDNIVLVLEGGGFGHGRGLSQWGSYGWAVEHGRNYQWILDHYYGGTVTSSLAAGQKITVRLLALDGIQTAVVSADAKAQVTGSTGSYGAIVARETATDGKYDVWGSTTVACPAASDPLAAPGWVKLSPAGGTTNPRFTVPTGETANSAVANLLAVCRPDGTVEHYRGSIVAINGSEGENRTVNDVSLESYLRGVVPRESPASWGNSGAGAGMHALRAQSVAARSYAWAQGRYTYAKTCDSQSCQVYEGAGRRPSATGALTILEDARTDIAIADTANLVRTRDGAIVSTEFSASNSARTAGGSFPAVDDPGDATTKNPNHVWTRVLDAAEVANRFAVPGSMLTAADKVPDAGLAQFDGLWREAVRLTGTSSKVVSTASFRSAYGLPSTAFTVRLVRRELVTPETFAFIGDSVGVGIADGSTSELPRLLNGVYGASRFDSITGRCTVGDCMPGTTDGLGAARAVPFGTDLVIVELGYNDAPSSMPDEIDQIMTALRRRDVGIVAWVNLSQRRTNLDGTPTYQPSNAALAAAATRWDELTVLDWNAASSGAERDRWYADGVHLTSTGQAQFALWLRGHALELSRSRKVIPSKPLRVKVTGVAGVPASGVTAVSLNVTAVGPDASGYMTVWPCGSPMPEASNVNYYAGQDVPNAVIAPVDSTGEICVYTYSPAHVLVDLNGWFTSTSGGGDLSTRVPIRIVDTRSGLGADRAAKRSRSMAPLRVRVTGTMGVPSTGVSAVSLNITATGTDGPGFMTVWPCHATMPEASNLNYEAGRDVANLVIAPVDADGDVCIYSYAAAHVLVDLNGWFETPDGAGGLSTRVPTRLVDTRSGLGTAHGQPGRVRPLAPLRLKVTDKAGVPASGVTAVALNVTAVGPTAPGFMTAWPCNATMPVTSNLNYEAGRDVANVVIAPVDSDGEVCVYTYAPADLVVDLSGWFTQTPGGGGLTTRVPVRIVDTRNGIGPIPGR